METNKIVYGLDIQAVQVADCECDIFDFIQKVEEIEGQCFICFSSNRRTQEGDLVKDTSRIQKCLDQSKAVGEIVLIKDRKSRVCALRSVTVE